ncbi:hypothetical protein [Nitrosophilus alvini]|uniref:hypothetical protein n=1 Tax=Nitrosophilus alvini TaxID=2714855 RepID=UPI001909945E|nr:hypothetical protein [Nitrosophilus alvini]
MVLEIDFSSKQNYIQKYIKAIAKYSNIDIKIGREEDKIVVLFDEKSENVEKFMKNLQDLLPYSLFMGKSGYVVSNREINEVKLVDIPLSLGLCPNCIKEMLDVESRRYYYPFTFCSNCGGHYAFFEKYPFIRENTYLSPFKNCEKCENEKQNNPFREEFALISCIECNIPIRAENRKASKTLWANDKGEYKKVFGIAAASIKNGEKVLVKTLFGFRLFCKTPVEDQNILITNANRVSNHFLLLSQEKHALFSIEKPIIRATVSNEKIKEDTGTSVARIKAPDEGFTLLLAKELSMAGIDYIYYRDVKEENIDYDILITFDLPINTQEECEYFINKNAKFFAKGERSLFPKIFENAIDTVSVAKGYAAVGFEGKTLIDKIDKVPKSTAVEVKVLDNEPIEIEHSNIKSFSADKAAFLSVIAENNVFDKSAVGVYFSKNVSFMLYSAKRAKRVMEFGKYNAAAILDDIKTLREGSDRLVENFKKRFEDICDQISRIEGEREDFLNTAAIIAGIGSEEELANRALQFAGKGGVAIDCGFREGKFDYSSFFASIMSYKLADIDELLLCYSIFESLGDFIASVVNEIREKTKAKNVVLSGKYIANQVFFSRFSTKLTFAKPLINREFPCDEQNFVYGGIFV